MSALIKLLGAVTPPPATPAPREFEGLEFRWRQIVFRPAAFKFEGIMLAILGGYIVLHLIGKAINMSRAKKAMAPFTAPLEAQFASVRPLLSSSSALHLVYATGRRNLLCLHSTLTLAPLHDILGLVWHVGKSIIEPTYDASENLVFTLTLGRGTNGLQGEGLGVWAILDKGVMSRIREQRWDLTFPRLHEHVNVPITHALFAEHSDVTDVLTKTPNVGITEVLADPVAAGILKYLLVTDVSSQRPTRGPLKPEHRAREIVLSIKKPANAEQEEAAKAWLQVALNVADLASRPNLLKPDVSRKIAKTRATVDADLLASYKKELAEDAPAEETAEEKRAAKKRAERAALSEKELKKIEDLERKREMRKMQKRQTK